MKIGIPEYIFAIACVAAFIIPGVVMNDWELAGGLFFDVLLGSGVVYVLYHVSRAIMQRAKQPKTRAAI